MNIRLKFEILTFSAAPETHFASIPMLGLTQHLWIRPLWFSTLQFMDHKPLSTMVYLLHTDAQVVVAKSGLIEGSLVPRPVYTRLG